MRSAFSAHPFAVAAQEAIAAIGRGAPVAGLETATLDFKEEAGRRDKLGRLRPGDERNDHAARALAEEACCLANSEGGALVVGVDDKGAGPGALIGTQMDAEWLRERIWECSEPRLGVDVEPLRTGDARLLLILVQRAYRLHRSAKRYKHRVGARCVEMTIEQQRRVEEERSGYDWSAEPSDLTAADASASAVEQARSYLRASGEESRVALAARPTVDLLRALGAITSDRRLTNAGKLLFADGSSVLIDYQRRRAPGSSSVDRLELTPPLLTAYTATKTRIDAVNEERELQLAGGVRPRVRLIPDRAAREAIVNALIHRDYRSPDPVIVELIGAQLIVSSPGGFPPGINAENIISERSHPRNASLASAFRSMRLAEQEGIGVDRMYRDMVSAGHRAPTFAERAGRVRCVLTGGEPSAPLVALTASLPTDAQDDVDLALIVHALLQVASVGPDDVAGSLQKLPQEAADALHRGHSLGLLQPAYGSTRARPRFRLSDKARERLRPLLPYLTTSSEQAEEFIVGHLNTHPSIKPRDVADMLQVTQVQGSRILRELREAGVLEFGSEQMRGRGAFHVPGPRFPEAAARHGLSAPPGR